MAKKKNLTTAGNPPLKQELQRFGVVLTSKALSAHPGK
jgi:hypothetical protein